MSRIAAIVLAMFFVVTVYSVAHSQQDIEPPQLLDVQFEPQVIDTSKGPRVITVTIHITDDLSGFADASLRFRQPATTQNITAEFSPPLPSRDPGLPAGYYQDTFTLPQYAAYGEWELHYVSLVDNVGNRLALFKPETEEEARNSNWPSLFNGFGFEVEELSGPQQSPSLYLPLLGL